MLLTWYYLRLDRLSLPVEVLFLSHHYVKFHCLYNTFPVRENVSFLCLSQKLPPSLLSTTFILFGLSVLLAVSVYLANYISNEDRTLGLWVPKFVLCFSHCWCSRSIFKVSVFVTKASGAAPTMIDGNNILYSRAAFCD